MGQLPKTDTNQQRQESKADASHGSTEDLMWPLNKIQKYFFEKRLTRKCRREIIQTIRENGIDSSYASRHFHQRSILGEYPRILSDLKELKRRGDNYELQFSYEYGGVHGEYIGGKEDPKFDEKWTEYSSKVARLNARLKTVRDTKRRAWQEVAKEEWEARNQKHGGRCPCCGGGGEISTGRIRSISTGFTIFSADGYPEMATCKVCCGRGSICSETLREFYEPGEWEYIDPFTSNAELPKDEDEIVEEFKKSETRPSRMIRVYLHLRTEPKK